MGKTQTTFSNQSKLHLLASSHTGHINTAIAHFLMKARDGSSGTTKNYVVVRHKQAITLRK